MKKGRKNPAAVVLGKMRMAKLSAKERKAMAARGGAAGREYPPCPRPSPSRKSKSHQFQPRGAAICVRCGYNRETGRFPAKAKE